MNELPKTVIIFGRTWKVTLEEVDEGICGDCDSDSEVITINPNQKRDKRTHSFLHEFFHAVFFRTGIFQGLDGEVIEVICENMATAILENFRLVKRNKK